ncbi:MAG: DinB family protein [Chloroflexi bacterium]|nr:DinB family protein [Chloroflexota bacterium]
MVLKTVKRAISGLVLERPVRNWTLDEFIAHLDRAGDGIAHHIAQAKGTDRNRAQLRHVIGIERWSQRRLMVTLGDDLIIDEYDDYRPDADMEWDALCAEFQTTRADTLSLLHSLAEVEADLARLIPHNQYGDLTVRGWLRYLDMHANAESRRIR